MEKRRLTSLRSVLLQYLVRTALACLLVAVGWLLGLLLWIQNDGPFLPANQAAQACQKAAQDVLPGMTAATFDETQLDSLCRYALFAAPDSSEVLATNMDAGHLQRAMENRQGKNRWHFGYTQYYMTSKLQVSRWSMTISSVYAMEIRSQLLSIRNSTATGRSIRCFWI